MNIGVITVQCGNAVLADGTDTGGRVDSDGSKLDTAQGGAVAQIVEFFRAQQINIFDRGNNRNEFSVKIRQVQDTVPDALNRYFTESDVLPTVALWTFAFQDAAGNYISAALNAAVKISRTAIGVTTMITYNLTGGRFTIIQTVPNNSFTSVFGGTATSTYAPPPFGAGYFGGSAHSIYTADQHLIGGTAAGF
jgi:hypothetical protein